MLIVQGIPEILNSIWYICHDNNDYTSEEYCDCMQILLVHKELTLYITKADVKTPKFHSLILKLTNRKRSFGIVIRITVLKSYTVKRIEKFKITSVVIEEATMKSVAR